MNRKGWIRLWATSIVSAAMVSAAAAAPPWGNLISLNSVDADSGKTYVVTEENGPWMIMASAFSGEGAQKQANELVLELRQRYKLQAFTYIGKFDIGEAQARGVDRYGRPKKAKYLKYEKETGDRARRPELTEVAVLVGNYRSAEDPNAQQALRTLKYAMPKCLEVKEGQQTNQTLTGWRMAQQKVYEMIGSEKKKLGPMRHAFITTNPVLPPEFFNQKAVVDEETAALNAGVPYSLLDCQGKFTVQVAMFKGNSVIRQDDVQRIQNGNKELKNQLAMAAQKADTLTRALRILGYDAYQYHDRCTSIVTVGSFNSPGAVRPDGGLDVDPDIQRILNVFRGGSPEEDANISQFREGLVNRTDLGRHEVRVMPKKVQVSKNEYIPLDVDPIVVVVPKRSFSLPFRHE